MISQMNRRDLKKKIRIIDKQVWKKYPYLHAPLEFFFQEQSYSSLHSGQSLAWDHVRGYIDDPCGPIADFCGVIADFCGVIADFCGVIAIDGRAGTYAMRRRQSLRDSLSIIKHNETS